MSNGVCTTDPFAYLEVGKGFDITTFKTRAQLADYVIRSMWMDKGFDRVKFLRDLADEIEAEEKSDE